MYAHHRSLLSRGLAFASPQQALQAGDGACDVGSVTDAFPKGA
jgi:hypothetical protein